MLELVAMVAYSALGAALSVSDFSFEGPLGCAGAAIEQLGENHFRIRPGHAPGNPGWANMAQFTILRNAKGNAPRIEVVFEPTTQYRFNDYFYSWSYDGEDWRPIHWEKGAANVAKDAPDALVFPVFEQDTVHVGHQVPLSYEDIERMVDGLRQNPCVSVHDIGTSLGGRTIRRVMVTDPASDLPRSGRWVHYFANQHPGEHNAQWRMVGIVNWLLSDAGADCRRRSICHFVFMMSPDAPSQGWYRVNAQGVDMNRSYSPSGADASAQAHEAYLAQKDLESLMASQEPPVTVWSMHTWGGPVEPILCPGPEMGSALGPWTDLRDAIERHNPEGLVEPLKAKEAREAENAVWWTDGPHRQFGVSAFLCEGAGSIYTKEENIRSGETLIKGLAEYYAGTRPNP